MLVPLLAGWRPSTRRKIYTIAIVSIVVDRRILGGNQHRSRHRRRYAALHAVLRGCLRADHLVRVCRAWAGVHRPDDPATQGTGCFIQAAHRAASFGAVVFLIIHIATRSSRSASTCLTRWFRFLSPFRTFYIGLGTIASDLILLLLITGIMRGRFNARGKAWRWRAISLHVLRCFRLRRLARPAWRPPRQSPTWTGAYGFVVAFVLVGLAVRVLSNSLRPKGEPERAAGRSVGQLGLRPAAGRGHARPVWCDARRQERRPRRRHGIAAGTFRSGRSASA